MGPLSLTWRRISWAVAAALAGVAIFLFWRSTQSVPKSAARAPLARSELAARVERPPLLERVAAPGAAGLPAEDSDVDRPRLPPEPMPAYKPRPPDEWQGMLVDVGTEPPCLDDAVCGLARACINSRCMACETDGDCEGGESCVLDHCVRTDRVKCKRSSDCASDSKCILSGYSPDIRGNETLDAYCIDPKGGSPKPRSIPRPPLTPEQLEAARKSDGIERDLERARAFR
jgi:hypothetical protein